MGRNTNVPFSTFISARLPSLTLRASATAFGMRTARLLPHLQITAGDHTRALTARHPIKPTSHRCPSAWQPNPGRRSTYRRGDSVQTTGTTSLAVSYTHLTLPTIL